MNIDEIIKNKNLKLTSARKELLELLLAENRPISFDDIKNSIKMDKATFYRNITKFEDQAIINSFESNDKKRYYEIQVSPHAHFICNICHKIECFENVKPTELKGYKITDMIFKGTCKDCNR